jgi:hypothetical protein
MTNQMLEVESLKSHEVEVEWSIKMSKQPSKIRLPTELKVEMKKKKASLSADAADWNNLKKASDVSLKLHQNEEKPLR